MVPGELSGRWSNGSVSVLVPSGIYQVTLEKKQRNAWKPVQTKHLDGSATSVEFTFAPTEVTRDLRVMGSAKRKFSPTAVTGVSQFDQETTESTGTSDGTLTLNAGGAILTANTTVNTITGTNAVASGNLTASGTANLVARTDTTATTTTAPSTVAAVEADIWKFSGDRLFYFNQLRGLQVFDMRDPAHPVKTGYIRMPAIGTQLQALDDTGRYVVLFTRRNDANYWDYNGSGMLRIVEVSPQGVPTVVKTISLDGNAGESRLFGNKLYVVTTGYDNNNYTLYSSGWYESRNWWRLHGYDLADPQSPVDLGSVQGRGYTPVLQASGGYLLVAGSGYGYTYTPTYQWRYFSTVSAVDFETDGKPHIVKTVETKQQVRDLFKMGVVNNAIVTVTQQDPRWEYKSGTSSSTDNANGTVTVIGSNTWTIYPSKTWVETFSLTSADTTPLAQLELDAAQGETLHATRFDGSKLYVVTFGVHKDGPETFTQDYTYTYTPWRWYLPTDPLFIIDLADPAHPTVRGQLEIPGYSTYIEVDGDRLIAVGREDNDVAVSLFDISNADAPTQIQRVYPGKGADSTHYSWTEAEWEHRAVNYMPDQGKLIVPVQTWDGSKSIFSTQTINVTHDSLALGPVVNMKDQARRGTSLKGYLVSISGRELAVHTDPQNGGTSTEAAWVELAWPVEQVIEVGDYLVQVESSAPGFSRSWWGWWGSSVSKQNVVRLTSRSDPDTIIDSVALPNLSAGIVAATERKGSIYVAQYLPASVALPAQIRTWMLRISNGHLVQVSDCTSEVPAVDDVDNDNDTNWNLTLGIDQIKPTWPSDDKLVWFAPCRESFWFNWWGWGTINIGSSIRLVKSSAMLFAADSLVAVSPTIATTTTTQTAPAPEKKPKRDRRHLPVAVAFPVGVSATLTAGGAVTVRRENHDLSLSEVSAPIADAGYLFFTSIQRQQSRYFPLVIANDVNGSEHDEEAAVSEVNGRSGKKYKFAVADLRVLDFTSGLDAIVRDPVSVPGALLSVASVDANGAWLMTNNSLTNQWGNGISIRSLAYDGVDAHQVDAIDTKDQNYGSYDSQGYYSYHYSYSYGVVAKDGLLFDSGYEYGYEYGYQGGNYTGGYYLARYRQQQTTGKLEALGSEQSGNYYSAPRISNGCLIASNYGGLSAWRINTDATLTKLGTTTWPYWSQLTSSYIMERAILSADLSGIWMPATDYGVEWLPFTTAEITP